MLVTRKVVPFESKDVQSIDPYINNADWWIININDVDTYRKGRWEDHRGNPADTVTTALGISNMIQLADLPVLAGSIAPKKYWQTLNDKPVLMSESDRSAVDLLESNEAEKKSRKAHVEAQVNREIQKVRRKERQDAAGRARGKNKITQEELDSILAED